MFLSNTHSIVPCRVSKIPLDSSLSSRQNTSRQADKNSTRQQNPSRQAEQLDETANAVVRDRKLLGEVRGEDKGGYERCGDGTGTSPTSIDQHGQFLKCLRYYP